MVSVRNLLFHLLRLSDIVNQPLVKSDLSDSSFFFTKVVFFFLKKKKNARIFKKKKVVNGGFVVANAFCEIFVSQ